MKKFVVLALVTILAVVWVAPVDAAEWAENEEALAWLRDQQEADGGFSSGFSEGSDYGATVEVILAAVAAGEDVSTWTSSEGASPLDYVASQVAGDAVTDAGAISKAVLVAVATGQDPRSFGDQDLIAALQDAAQSADTGMYGSTLFAHAYGMLALHNAGVPLSEDAVAVLTSQVTEDGGWALFGETESGATDTNTTALAMQALVAAEQSEAAAEALAYLHEVQNEDGGFPYQNPSDWGTETDANSTAVVLQALNALDEPMSDWAPSDTDPVDALSALWDESTGAYVWKLAEGTPNLLATAQAVQATEGMTLVDVPVVEASQTPEVMDVSAPLLPSSGGAAWTFNLIWIGLFAVAGGWLLKRRS